MEVISVTAGGTKEHWEGSIKVGISSSVEIGSLCDTGVNLEY